MAFEKKREHILELVRYGFWGVITVLFSMFSYALFVKILDYKIANLVSIILTKAFAYFTNKKFVFKTNTNIREQIKEIFKFILTRGFTGIIDWVGLIVFVEVFLIDDIISKSIMIVITTILNYILGKYAVFNTKHIDKI